MGMYSKGASRYKGRIDSAGEQMLNSASPYNAIGKAVVEVIEKTVPGVDGVRRPFLSSRAIQKELELCGQYDIKGVQIHYIIVFILTELGVDHRTSSRRGGARCFTEISSENYENLENRKGGWNIKGTKATN